MLAVTPEAAEPYFDFHVPVFQSYWANGVWHHNSGKSSFIEAMAWAFWGRTLRGTQPWNEEIPAKERALTVQTDSLQVQLPALRVLAVPTWTLVGYATAKQMHAALALQVGSYDEWRLSHVLSSKDVASFSAASPGARMALLSSVLRMGVLEKAAERAKTSAGTIRERQSRLRNQQQLLAAKVAAAETALSVTDAAILALGGGQEAPEAPSESLDVAEGHRASIRALQRQRDAVPVLSTARCEACGAVKGATPAALEAERAERQYIYREITRLEDEASRIEALHRRYMAERLEHQRRAAGALEVQMKMLATRTQLLTDRDELADTEAMQAVVADQLRLEDAAHIALSREIPYDMLEEGFAAYTRIANGYLERIALGKFQVRIAGTRDLASGKVKQEASLTIEGLKGPRGQYEAASSGEQRRVDIALLLAVGDLAREYAGTPQGPLFLDEALDSLDVNGRAAVVEVLAELAHSRPILLISHESLPVRGATHLHLKG